MEGSFMVSFFICRRKPEECRECGFCTEYFCCPGVGKPSIDRFETACVDCGVCYLACPYMAVERVKDTLPRKEVTIIVDGNHFTVLERTTIKRALELLGLEFGKFPGEAKIFAPCETGGCYACALLVDGKPKTACVTPVQEGMIINLTLPEDHVPLRRVSGFQPHAVGGVGTPWWVKKSGRHYVEVACFAHGCNLRCLQCQNYTVTYDNLTPPSTPSEAAEVLTAQRNKSGLDRMAISGGEPTLNRPWLIRFFQELHRLNLDPHARLHLDTNATVLTPEYVDLLVEAGMTDCGIDLKALNLKTFQRITGMTDRGLAKDYLRNEWEAARYLVNEYSDKVFTGVGVIWNKHLMKLEEIRDIGDRIVKELGQDIQVTALDYRAQFRRQHIGRPGFQEMKTVKKVLEECGLECVICQTEFGHIGP